MERKSYASDLTDEQWRLIATLLSAARPGDRPRSVDLREVVHGLFHVARTGIPWRSMPH